MDWNTVNWTAIIAIATMGTFIVGLCYYTYRVYSTHKSEKEREKDKIARPLCEKIDELIKRVEDFEEMSTFEENVNKAKQELPSYKKEIDVLIGTTKEYNELLTSAKYFIKYGMYVCCGDGKVKKLMDEFDELAGKKNLPFLNLSSNLAEYLIKPTLKGEEVKIGYLEDNYSFWSYIEDCNHSSDLKKILPLIKDLIIEKGNGLFKELRKERESVITSANELKRKFERDYKICRGGRGWRNLSVR